MHPVSPRQLEKLSKRLLAFIGTLSEGVGRKARKEAMQSYITGLLMDGKRKSMEPMAARLVRDPADRDAMRQRLQHFITDSDWDDGQVRKALALHLEAKLHDIDAFAIDDTGFEKKGESSVGVARQYSGTLGRVGNCQVATSLHLVSEASSASIGMRLYLPKAWAEDEERREKVGVPEEVEFQPKWKIGLDLLAESLEWGVSKRPVLADAGYGDCFEFRNGLDERGLPYVVGISETTLVWRPGEEPSPAGKNGADEAGRNSADKSKKTKPVSVLQLARERRKRKLHTVTWRQGSKGPQKSRFGFVRIHAAHGYKKREPPGQEQWLIYEWPRGEDKPTKFWLSTLSEKSSKRKLVKMAKVRWRIERDYQDMKQEVGLNHFEGRKWRGFHHHVTLCIAAHAFLALNRAFSPQGPPRPSRPEIPDLASLEASASRGSIALGGHMPIM